MVGSRKLLLGARIKELRKRAGLSQDQLSEKVGVESKYLSRIETGKRYPSLETLEGIAEALNAEMKELFDFSHHDAEAASPRGIEDILAGASREELKLIFKLIQAVRQ